MYLLVGVNSVVFWMAEQRSPRFLHGVVPVWMCARESRESADLNRLVFL